MVNLECLMNHTIQVNSCGYCVNSCGTAQKGKKSYVILTQVQIYQ